MSTSVVEQASIADMVTSLQARLAALGDKADCKSEREFAAYRTRYDTIQSCISALRNLPNDLLQEQKWLDKWTTERDTLREALLPKQEEMETELAVAPHTSFERQKWESTRKQLDKVKLDLHDMERQVAEMTERRNRVQLSLDAALTTASQLLA